jgi:hypothetical protein
MHPVRLDYLAYNNAQERKIIEREKCERGHWTFKLECGHESCGVGHFDYRHETTRRCFECGVEYVKTAPQWAHEFDRVL